MDYPLDHPHCAFNRGSPEGFPMSQWWVSRDNPPGLPSAPAIGGGGSPQAGMWRSQIDRARSAASPHPNDYPDGYLGTIVGRRQDKLMDAVQERLTERSYQRGVHVGSKIGTDAYFWPVDQSPQSRLQSQAQARKVRSEGVTTFRVERPRPTGAPVEHLAHMGKTSGMMSPEQESAARQYGVPKLYTDDLELDPERTKRMKHLLPSYG